MKTSTWTEPQPAVSSDQIHYIIPLIGYELIA